VGRCGRRPNSSRAGGRRIIGHREERAPEDIRQIVETAEREAAVILTGTPKPNRNVAAVVASAERDLAKVLQDDDGIPASMVTNAWLTGIRDTPAREFARAQSRHDAMRNDELIAAENNRRLEVQARSLRGRR
jgi:hypothetical protein